MKNASKWCANFCAKNPIPSGLKKYGAVKVEGEVESSGGPGGPGGPGEQYTKSQVISMSRDTDLKKAGYNYVDGAWKPGPKADYESLYSNVVGKYELNTESESKNVIPMTKGKGAKYGISKGGLFGKKGHQKLRRK